MERKELLINLLFFLIVIPIIISIFNAYVQFKEKNYINYANPLNLQVKNVMVTEDYIDLIIYNPNNFTVSIIINLVGVRNSFGSAAALTMGGDLGIIKTIFPRSSVNFKVEILKAYTDPRRVILQWLNAGGNLTIVLHYNEPNRQLSGTIIKKVSK